MVAGSGMGTGFSFFGIMRSIELGDAGLFCVLRLWRPSGWRGAEDAEVGVDGALFLPGWEFYGLGISACCCGCWDFCRVRFEASSCFFFLLRLEAVRGG